MKVVQIYYRKRLESKFIANFIFKLASNLKHFNLQFETLLAFTEAATGGFLVKKVFQKFRKVRRKKPLPNLF